MVQTAACVHRDTEEGELLNVNVSSLSRSSNCSLRRYNNKCSPYFINESLNVIYSHKSVYPLSIFKCVSVMIPLNFMKLMSEPTILIY